MTVKFSVVGCQHPHIRLFIQEMLDLGHECAGIYEKENLSLASTTAEHFNTSLVPEPESLLDESVGLVGSAAVNNEKIDVIEICERFGKPVMIDKPAVTCRRDYDRLEAVVRRGNIQIGMLLTERFRPSVRTLKQHIQSGVFGDIVHISMRKPHRLTPQKRPAWHFSKKRNGGIVIDLFVHDVDLLRWLTGGEVASIEGCMAKNILPEHPDFYDTAQLSVQMENHVLGQLYADWHTPEKSWTWGDGRIFVTGTEGTAELRLEGDPLLAQDEMLLQVTHREAWKKVRLAPSPCSVTEDFLRRLQGEDYLVGHEDILRATRATLDADANVRVLNRFDAAGNHRHGSKGR